MLYIDICGHLLNFEKIVYIKFMPEGMLITFSGGACFDIGIDTGENRKSNLYALLVSKEKLETIGKNLRDKALGNI